MPFSVFSLSPGDTLEPTAALFWRGPSGKGVTSTRTETHNGNVLGLGTVADKSKGLEGMSASKLHGVEDTGRKSLVLFMGVRGGRPCLKPPPLDTAMHI